MLLKTERFGEIEINENNIIDFPQGILGFPNVKRYTFILEEDNDVFLWLQGIEEDIAFIVTNPLFFKPDYKIELPEEEIKELKAEKLEDISIFTIVTVPADPQFTSINLQGPLLINPHKNIGKQVVLLNEEYPLKYFIFMNKKDLAEAI